MANIQATPAPGPPPPPPAPGPPAAGPSSGSVTGAPVDSPLGLSATKGSGGAGGGGGGGGGNNKGEGETATATVETNSLGLDRTGSSTNDFALGQMTLQAALSHLRKNGEVMAPSPSELSAINKALREHGLVLGKSGGAAIVDHFDAAEAALGHLGEMQDDLEADFQLRKQLGFDALAEQDLDARLFEDFQENIEASVVQFDDRSVLQGARAFSELSTLIATEFQPRSESDHDHLRELITDPRAGFAPEGLAAWDLEQAQGLRLSKTITGRSDFSEIESGLVWSVVPLNASDENFVDLTRATKEADTNKMHVLVDANAISPTPRLVSAIRTASTSHPKVRVHLSINAQG